jgi:hypothetical protein
MRDASDRNKTYLPDVDERCLNCGRGYSRHDGSSCYPAALEASPAAAAADRDASRLDRGRAARVSRDVDQLELQL